MTLASTEAVPHHLLYFKPLIIYLQILPFLFSQLKINFRLFTADSNYILKKVYRWKSQKHEGHLYSEGFVGITFDNLFLLYCQLSRLHWNFSLLWTPCCLFFCASWSLTKHKGSAHPLGECICALVVAMKETVNYAHWFPQSPLQKLLISLHQ